AHLAPGVIRHVVTEFSPSPVAFGSGP
ncbi:hypothetical protein CEXT_485231, partial [Caerostris extrusa]